MEDIILIHECATGFKESSVPGVQSFVDRAMLMPGSLAIVGGKSRRSEVAAYFGYLSQVSIGPCSLRLSDDLMNPEVEVQKDILNRVEKGAKIQFFCSTAAEEALVKKLGLRWEKNVFAPPPALYEKANDKASVRRLAFDLGQPETFPPHEIVPMSRVVSSVIHFWNLGHAVVVKLPHLVSGDGMAYLLVGDQKTMREWIGRHKGYTGEVIVEQAFYSHVPMSYEWKLFDDGPKPVCATAQIIHGNGFSHVGNYLARDNHGLPGVKDDDIWEMHRLSYTFVNHYYVLGYRGVIGFDFIKTERGRVYMLECNGRVTATTYAAAVGRQIDNRVHDWAIAMEVISIGKQVNDFAALTAEMKHLLYHGSYGILPFLPRLLPQRLGLMAIAPNAEKAGDMLDDVKKRLEAY